MRHATIGVLAFAAAVGVVRGCGAYVLRGGLRDVGAPPPFANCTLAAPLMPAVAAIARGQRPERVPVRCVAAASYAASVDPELRGALPLLAPQALWPRPEAAVVRVPRAAAWAAAVGARELGTVRRLLGAAGASPGHAADGAAARVAVWCAFHRAVDAALAHVAPVHWRVEEAASETPPLPPLPPDLAACVTRFEGGGRHNARVRNESS